MTPSSSNDDNLERRHLQSNIFLNDKVLEGKERLLRIIAKLGGERNNVVLIDVQRLYYSEYGVFLDKSELRRYFPTSHIKAVFETYMRNELEISTDPYRSGSLFMRMKMSFSDVVADIRRILDEKSNFNGDDNFEESTPATNDDDEDIFASLNSSRVSAFSLSGQTSKSSKFHLNENATVERAYAMRNLDGVSRESMAPYIKKEMKDGQQRSLDDGSSAAKPTSSNVPVARRHADIPSLLDLEFDEKLTIEPMLLHDFDSDDSHSVVAFGRIGNGLSVSDRTSSPTGRLIGNVEELEQILMEQFTSSYSRYSNNGGSGTYNSNGTVKKSISTLPSANCNQPNRSINGSGKSEASSALIKPAVKYTKRCEGIFTDDEYVSSSEDELEAGNRDLMREKAAAASLSKTDDEQSSFKSMKSFVAPDSTTADLSRRQRDEDDQDDFESIDQSRRVLPSEPRGCHAEKYLRMALIRQEESEARRLAHRIAHFQKFNPNAPVERIFASRDADTSRPMRNGGTPHNPPAESVQERSAGSLEPIIDIFAVPSVVAGNSAIARNSRAVDETKSTSEKNGNFTTGGYFIDEDFQTNFPNRVQRPMAATPRDSNDDLSSADLLHSVQLRNGDDGANELSAGVYALAATISLVVMNRKPSVAMTDLERALRVIYGRNLVPGTDFPENNLKDFIEKYCRNVFAISVPLNTLYVWKAQGDASFRTALTRIGKFCVEGRPPLL